MDCRTETGDRHVPMTCGVCRRSARGFAYTKTGKTDAGPIPACSMEHLTIMSQTYGETAKQYDERESKAIDEAGLAIEAYCDKTGVFDMREFSGAQWNELKRNAIQAYINSMADSAPDMIPY